jgi:hypothetical protein
MTGMAPTPPSHHPALRTAMLVAGVLLIVAAPVVGLLPGPGGIFVFAGGLILVLRASRWARLRWARLKRRFPRLGHLADRVMRRPSALRRHARAQALLKASRDQSDTRLD